MDRLQTPPIRTTLQDSGARTVKEWYLYWQQSGEQLNANTQKLAGLVTSGTHAERPDAGTMPEGAMYMESDRHVIYQVQDGEWHYVAGVMLGTMSPDQRPTDLGPNDTGFQFKAVDTQQQFYWSGSAWIETASVLYGTHAARPAASSVPTRVLYIETDRGNVIYQQQGGNWKYVAGVMAGTISPDQRPAGLGANDTGFQFHASDTRQILRWDGAAWMDMGTPQNLALYAAATAGLTLTVPIQAVPGASVTVTRTGRYIVTMVFMFSTGGAGDIALPFYGRLALNGVLQSNIAVFVAASAVEQKTISQQSYLSVTAGDTLSLWARKVGGTGTSTVDAGQTNIAALWVEP